MRWKIKAASESKTMPEGVRRVYVAMVMLSDWKGRLKANILTIAACSCLSERHVRRILPLLYDSGDVICTTHGQGRRPGYYYLLPLRSADTLDVRSMEPVVRTFQ